MSAPQLSRDAVLFNRTVLPGFRTGFMSATNSSLLHDVLQPTIVDTIAIRESYCGLDLPLRSFNAFSA